jgi:hypothetical protein
VIAHTCEAILSQMRDEIRGKRLASSRRSSQLVFRENRGGVECTRPAEHWGDVRVGGVSSLSRRCTEDIRTVISPGQMIQIPRSPKYSRRVLPAAVYPAFMCPIAADRLDWPRAPYVRCGFAYFTRLVCPYSPTLHINQHFFTRSRIPLL